MEERMMGQYWICINLDKKEFIHPHKLGCGLKLWEQLANYPGTGAALIILLANMPERRGGGDFEENPTVGRWAGDRVILVGDYGKDGDLEGIDTADLYETAQEQWKDISDDVAAVIEHELEGKYEGDGWRHFKDNERTET
jgi:hypothetical protein